MQQYKSGLDPARAGHIADTADKTLISLNAEEVIGFGVPLAQGATDTGCIIATTGATEIIGISVRDRSACNDVFDIGDSVRVMTEGPIWVPVVAAVAAGDPVHVDLASSGFTNTGGVQLMRARYETSQSVVGELARIRIK